MRLARPAEEEGHKRGCRGDLDATADRTQVDEIMWNARSPGRQEVLTDRRVRVSASLVTLHQGTSSYEETTETLTGAERTKWLREASDLCRTPLIPRTLERHYPTRVSSFSPGLRTERSARR